VSVAEMHDKGASQWGGDWLEANIRACNVMMSSGLRPEEHKAMGTLMAWKLCQWGDMIRERELAAIRVSFPEGHKARTDGDVAGAVRELVAERIAAWDACDKHINDWHNALDQRDEARQERDQLRELVTYLKERMGHLPWCETTEQPPGNCNCSYGNVEARITAALAPPVKEK